ncbi:glycosyltransferase family 2 protein [Rurimicrobium arvi]|uniref:Glycosyltransferase family 2 protein n=1 Tax=Rurimicrobium arvi TaxID=2049916 RepID=A0ABP8MF12_9BACT
MANPLVSICIPSYNRADLIEETIASALAQTYTNIEVIVNDNCSTDSSWQLLQELAAKDARLRIFQNESNLGAVRNWQSVMKHAQGQYALILWSDDLVKETFVEATLAAFTDDVAFVMTGVQEFDGTGVYYSSDYRMSGLVSVNAYLQEVLFKNKNRLPVSPSCALFRTADLKKNIHAQLPNSDGIDFNKTGAGPDLLTFLLAAKDYPDIYIIPEHLALFRSHASSITVMASQQSGLKLHYDWAKFFFVRGYLPEMLPKFKAITKIRYILHKRIHANMLRDMRTTRTDYFFMLRLFFQ